MNKNNINCDTFSCSDGYLRIYVRGQEEEHAYDKPDREECGTIPPQPIVAPGPRLFMVFSSGESVGAGFRARYKFETGELSHQFNLLRLRLIH